MIGKVQNVQELIKTTKNEKETTRFKFEITDGRCAIIIKPFST